MNFTSIFHKSDEKNKKKQKFLPVPENRPFLHELTKNNVI